VSTSFDTEQTKTLVTNAHGQAISTARSRTRYVQEPRLYCNRSLSLDLAVIPALCESYVLILLVR
jgi:hypothetical protein